MRTGRPSRSSIRLRRRHAGQTGEGDAVNDHVHPAIAQILNRFAAGGQAAAKAETTEAAARPEDARQERPQDHDHGLLEDDR